MRFYKGAFSEQAILDMPYMRFTMYVEYMSYMEREQSEDFADYNRMLDRQDAHRFGKMNKKKKNDDEAARKQMRALAGKFGFDNRK